LSFSQGTKVNKVPDVAADVKEITPTGVGGMRFTVASRPQARFSNTQTVSNLGGATSFQPIQAPATGWVRYFELFFTAVVTSASAGAVVAGDAPWNLPAAITLTDATGQPIIQPISGYNLYLKNKYSATGTAWATNMPRWTMNPHMGPEYAFSSTATTGTAVFRLILPIEQDFNSGYGCIPNLDSNASLQLKIDVAASTVAFTGTTTTVATLAVRVSQHYWAPVGAMVGGAPAMTQPIGAGDFLETRYETNTLNASAENLVTLTNRGGLIKNTMIVSRAAGVRTAYTAASPVGVILDNNPIFEGILLEEWYDMVRRIYGYLGTDLITSYAPIAAGTLPGLDRGVIPFPFFALSGGRDSWLNRRVGSLYQLRVSPGASATQFEAMTELEQVKDAGAFYEPSALN
jgi:hypothetical protein